ncbi:Na+/H+ antiporter NhaC family protein [Virgibacillus sp. MSJ-26]|uniref:Na+/H+ antiporter NhaC family protein n=1 Tax=Virgibacillus sp. MSJ-26 TaxID=2841522 RepID=UPI001C11BC11|nr:Na+/H+ antiporter NhaC family protein [Virgibacillus sp. MSJ-26]MBU5465454.1 Na+/H+ antiporter NhaC family protein [Virgibacillus sp. MSJ-26]
MDNTIWSLVPPILAIIMVLVTRRVLLSLGVGIIASAFFIASFNFPESFSLIWESFRLVFVEDNALNTGNVYILLFVLMLGIMTAFVSMMGGTKAFGDWMIKRVRTRSSSQIMTMFLGIVIFIDDYFNSLTVGPIARPVTDKHRVSRAKLAYIVDSTAAPVSVVAPISSWGAYIIGIIASILVAQNVTEYGAFEAFIKMIPMNLYVWAALGVVLVIALRQVDFGPMKKHENRAIETGEVSNPENKEQIDIETKLPMSNENKISDLILPIGILFIATLVIIFITGFGAVEGDKTLMNIFGEADVNFALFCGGIIGVITTFLLFSRHLRSQQLSMRNFKTGVIEGAKSMLPAFAILIFAWAITFLIGELGTGNYLAGIVESSNISLSLLPVIVFIMAGFIAFATGTSWGSFALLLPIAGQIAGSTDISLLLPVLAAVLGGAVFGDHCSPISDTTILSATGAGSELMDHVTTQLLYALVAAFIASLGYLGLGLFGNMWIGLGIVVISLAVLFAVLRPTDDKSKMEEEPIAK